MGQVRSRNGRDISGGRFRSNAKTFPASTLGRERGQPRDRGVDKRGSQRPQRSSFAHYVLSDAKPFGKLVLTLVVPIRRVVAAALMVTFTVPLLMLLYAGRHNSLPACCRRDGKHRCTMAMEATGWTSAGPVFRNALPDCPFRSHPSHPSGAKTASKITVTSVRLLTNGAIHHKPRIVHSSFNHSLKPSRGPPAQSDDVTV